MPRDVSDHTLIRSGREFEVMMFPRAARARQAPASELESRLAGERMAVEGMQQLQIKALASEPRKRKH
jgi:hypothetical protein